MERDKRAIHEQWCFFCGPGGWLWLYRGLPQTVLWLTVSWPLALLAQRPFYKFSFYLRWSLILHCLLSWLSFRTTSFLLNLMSLLISLAHIYTRLQHTHLREGFLTKHPRNELPMTIMAIMVIWEVLRLILIMFVVQ